MASIDANVFEEKLYPHFLELSKCKRPSKDEKEAIDFIITYAESLNLEYSKDSLGNVAVYRPASPGKEGLSPLLFQGHVDMVCVPDKNIFPIEPVITEGWVHTDGTTLGADNGIAIAMMFELMRMSFEVNPPLEFLFTTAEEIGLVGASNIDTEKIELKSTKLINIDSEDIDHITVGCSGGLDITLEMPIGFEDSSGDSYFELTVKCPGGHSGLDIHRDIPSALKIAGEFLGSLEGVSISGIGGGLARNAIPPEAKVIFSAGNCTVDSLKDTGNRIIEEAGIRKSCEILVGSIGVPDKVLKADAAKNLIKLLRELPHGVLKMNPDTGGVLASINLAVLEISDSNAAIQMNTRSSDVNEKEEAFNAVKNICDGFGCSAVKGDDYPGWRPDINSELLKVTADKFTELRGSKPEYLDIHAGLECGILMDKFHSVVESVSIGPNIRNAHSVKEKLEIVSTVEIWEIVKNIIAHYSK
ncbi:MAG: aminoacyl-histidine dipeptidase [bacterium]|nr:aminoacyl-histidine dipeptidase [bacterium]